MAGKKPMEKLLSLGLPLRNVGVQVGNRASEQLIAVVAQQLLGLTVEHLDTAIVANRKICQRGIFVQNPVLLLTIVQQLFLRD